MNDLRYFVFFFFKYHCIRGPRHIAVTLKMHTLQFYFVIFGCIFFNYIMNKWLVIEKKIFNNSAPIQLKNAESVLVDVACASIDYTPFRFF